MVGTAIVDCLDIGIWNDTEPTCGKVINKQRHLKHVSSYVHSAIFYKQKQCMNSLKEKK